MTKQAAIPRDADKFVVRMPDTMRERIANIAKKLKTSMNSAIIKGLTAWLDDLDEMEILLEGVRLLKTSLEQERKNIAAEREEIANLKSQLEGQLSGKGHE